MVDDTCFSTYARFTCNDPAHGLALVGPDNLIGDAFTLRITSDEAGNDLVEVVNKFAKSVGQLEQKEVHHLQVLQARVWTLRALLSLVVAAKGAEGTEYWGEVLILCNDARYDAAFSNFTNKLAALLMEGIRPDVEFGAQGIKQIIASEGNWDIKNRAAKPKLSKDEAIVKDHRSAKEKMIEEGRAGNKGCFAMSYLFIALVVALIVAAVAHFALHLF